MVKEMFHRKLVIDGFIDQPLLVRLRNDRRIKIYILNAVVRNMLCGVFHFLVCIL